MSEDLTPAPPPKGWTPKEPPTINCLLLCDDVMTSTRQQKHYLHGVVDHIVAPGLPALVGPYVVYMRISNVYSNQKIKVAMHPADNEEEEVFSFEAQSPPENKPLDVHIIIAQLPPFAVVKAGRYFLCAKHDEIAFARTRIKVIIPGDSGENTDAH